MSDAILAVDFGTTTTSAVLVADGEIIPIEEPLDGTDLLIGTQATQRMQVHPESFRAEFKRDLGQDARIVLGKRGFTPVRLVTELIKALRAEAERVHGGAIDRAEIGRAHV